MRRTLCLALYYGLASHLPNADVPGGELARRLRQALVRGFLAQSRGPITIDSRVFFADGRDVRIDVNSGIGQGSHVYGATIGRSVTIGPYVTLLKQNHVFSDLDAPMGEQGMQPPAPPVIEDGARIGERAIVLPGRRIGRHAIVEAGAVVTRDVAPFTTVVGNPARVVGT